MKQPIPVAGSIIIVILISLTTYLAFGTNLLVPQHMKEKSRNNPFNYEEYNNNQQVSDFDEVPYENYEGYVPGTPIFDDEIDLSNLQVSKPAGFNNLSICLIYGKTDLDSKKYITLSNALKQNMVVVHETQDVNTLTMDNKSNNYIYINSGEIVKGGQQDRTIQYDVVIAPHATNVDLASFCVESGRWSAREGEDVYAFESSEKMLSTNSLKLAAKKEKNQGQVWAKVEEFQACTDSSVTMNAMVTDENFTVRSEVSGSSLELALENEEIEKLQEEYRTTIKRQLKNRKDVTGFAYFINGKLYGIDVFNNHQLFADLFNKLLDAAIAEAITVYDKKAKIPAVSEGIVSLLLAANAKVYQDETVNDQTQFRTSQHNTAKNVLIFTSFDRKAKSWLHRNWLEDTGSYTIEEPVQEDEPVLENNETLSITYSEYLLLLQASEYSGEEEDSDED